ncbi:MAG: polysaccharide biosynthesis/export family protein [Elusimicrobiota bacterium]
MNRLPLLLFSACATGPAAPGAKPLTKQSQAEEAAIASALQEVASKKTDYRISGADLIQISVLGEKDMDRQIRVSQNGTITYPLVGSVKVGGLSTSEAEAAIAAKLNDFLRGAQVTVFIKEYGNKKVFVFGHVNKPGAIEIPTETKLTVLEAISQAGGFASLAAPDRTRVVRMLNGVSQSFTIEVSAITKKGEKEKDIALEPNDIVFIPESYF